MGRQRKIIREYIYQIYGIQDFTLYACLYSFYIIYVFQNMFVIFTTKIK